MNAPNENGSHSGDVELNITPIIDCFTVLITFLLASASFISIGFFEASTPGPGTDAQAKKPDLDASIRIAKNHRIELKWNGIKNGNLSIDAADLQKLSDTLQSLKPNQAMISASDEIEFSELAKVMAAVDRTGVPAIVGDFQE